MSRDGVGIGADANGDTIEWGRGRASDDGGHHRGHLASADSVWRRWY